MSKDSLIVKQQLEIERLKEINKVQKKALNSISVECVGGGAPLNDNVKGYSHKQMGDFFRINEFAQEGLNPDVAGECACECFCGERV